MALTYRVGGILAALEATPRDGTVVSLNSSHSQRVEEWEAVFQPMMEESAVASGGPPMAVDVWVGESFKLTGKIELIPMRITELLTETPQGHVLLMASGAVLDLIDDSTKLEEDSAVNGNGTPGPFNFTVAEPEIWPGSVVVIDRDITAPPDASSFTPQETFSDNGAGVLAGDDGGAGTVNYVTGAIAVTFGNNLAASRSILATYQTRDDTANLDTGLDGDGATDTFAFRLPYRPIEAVAPAGTVAIKDGAIPVETFTDDGAGVMTGDQGGAGTIDYTTGEVEITFNTAPLAGVAILASWTHPTPGPYRVRYLFGCPGASTAALNCLLFDKASNRALEYKAEGVRFSPKFTASRQARVMVELDGAGVGADLGQLGGAAPPANLPPFAAYKRGVPSVSTAALCRQRAHLTERGEASDVDFSGKLLDLEASPNYRLELLEAASDDQGFDAIELVPEAQSISVGHRLDSLPPAGWNLVRFARLSAAISTEIEWKDVTDAANKILLYAVQGIRSEGLEITGDDNGAASMKTAGKVIAGQPVVTGGKGSGVGRELWKTAAELGTDPAEDFIVLEFYTDPTLNPLFASAL